MWSIFKKTKKVYRNREQVLREEGYTREDGSNLSPDGRILLNGPTEVDSATKFLMESGLFSVPVSARLRVKSVSNLRLSCQSLLSISARGLLLMTI